MGLPWIIFQISACRSKAGGASKLKLSPIFQPIIETPPFREKTCARSQSHSAYIEALTPGFLQIFVRGGGLPWPISEERWRTPHALFRKCLAGAAQGVVQGVPRQSADDGVDHPSEAGRDAAAQGNSFAFDVDATIALLETPVGVQPPEESVVFAGGQFVLVATAGILNLGKTRAA